jgi:hypothetical protein
MMASRAVSGIHHPSDSGGPVDAAAQRGRAENRIDCISSKNFFSIVFRLTGPRGGRFSPATDVITS